MTAMERADIDKLRNLPIEGVARRLGLQPKQRRCLCPFHDDSSPSLSFSVSRNTYRCWSCSAHGDSIDLVRGVLHKSFTEACRWLADENAVILRDNTLQPKTEEVMVFPAAFYTFLTERMTLGTLAEDFLFNERRYSRQVVTRQHITSIECSGYRLLAFLRRHFTEGQLEDYGILRGEKDRRHCFFWTPCLLIPYFSADNELVSVQARYLGTRLRFADSERQKRHDAMTARAPRFQFSPGSHPMIYNLPVLRDIKPGEELWVTEGVSDCLAVMSSGRKAIAIPSATLLTARNKQLLASAPSQNWHMAPDTDAAGESLCQALLKTASEVGATLTRHQLPEGCKDFSDYWKNRRKFFSDLSFETP